MLADEHRPLNNDNDDIKITEYRKKTDAFLELLRAQFVDTGASSLDDQWTQ